MEKVTAGAVNSFIGVRAEVVALGLDEIGREPLPAVAIVEGQAAGEGGHGDAQLHGAGDRIAPAQFRGLHFLPEVVVEQQVGELWLSPEGLHDLVEKGSANDAARAPQRSNLAKVDVPTECLGGSTQQHEALAIGDNFGSVEGSA